MAETRGLGHLAEPKGVRYGVFVLGKADDALSVERARMLLDAFQVQAPDLLKNIFWDCSSVQPDDRPAADLRRWRAMQDALVAVVIVSPTLLSCGQSKGKLKLLLNRMASHPHATVLPIFCGDTSIRDLRHLHDQPRSLVMEEGKLLFADNANGQEDHRQAGSTGANQPLADIAKQAIGILKDAHKGKYVNELGAFSEIALLGKPEGKAWHVFLSHSGAQKSEFVEWIYQGILARFPLLEGKVFLDKHSLPKGNDGTNGMYAALQDSHVGIVVLSKEYVLSPDCMDELYLLLERKRRDPQSQAVVLPVFYAMPWHHIWKHVDKYRARVQRDRPDVAGGVDQVSQMELLNMDSIVEQQYADDLQGLGCISGFTGYYAGGDQWHEKQLMPAPELVAEIVERVGTILHEKGQLPVRPDIALPAEERRVGLDAKECGSPLWALLEAVKKAKEQHRAVLLHGMPGIGKTTLAKAAFLELHQAEPTVRACFLQPEQPYTAGSVMGLQRKLLDDLRLLKSASQFEPTDCLGGQQIITDKLQDLAKRRPAQKVLVVVDNLWERHLEHVLPSDLMQLLAPGSVVVLCVMGVGSKTPKLLGGAVLQHEAQHLSDEQSRELVEAVSGTKWQATEDQWREQVIVGCGGNPGALLAIGSYLAAKPNAMDGFITQHQVAGAMAGIFKEAGGVFDELTKSWEELKDDQKLVLLDIAMFLDNQQLKWVEESCPHSTLDAIRQVGLLQTSCERAASAESQSCMKAVSVHPVVKLFFSEGGAFQAQQDKLTLICREPPATSSSDQQPDSLSNSDAEEVENTEGLWLAGYRVQEAHCKALSSNGKIRIARLDKDTCEASLALKSPSLRWLRCEAGAIEASIELELKRRNTPTVAILQSQKQLKKVTIRGKCSSGNTGPPVGRLQGLQLEDCPDLETVTLTNASLNLRLLEVRGCPKLATISGLEDTNLREFICGSDLLLARCSPLLTCLRVLELETNTGELSALLRSLTSLSSLTLRKSPNIQSISSACLVPLQTLAQLTVLDCHSLQHLELPPVLQRLHVEGCQSLLSIPALAAPGAGVAVQLLGVQSVLLKNLESVVVKGCPRLVQRRCAEHVLSSCRVEFTAGNYEPVEAQAVLAECSCVSAAPAAAAAGGQAPVNKGAAAGACCGLGLPVMACWQAGPDMMDTDEVPDVSQPLQGARD